MNNYQKRLNEYGNIKSYWDLILDDNNKKPENLSEQDNQVSLFPYGEWEFPVGWEKDDDYISDLKHNVPEHVFSKIFQMWDENGIDFSIFKLLGVQPDTVTSTYVLKRYIQNTTKPIPVSYTFNCDDLAELFDTTSRDYDLGYVKEYLCGDDSFWDSDDWYNYEWDSYMTDQIDENNWKTISEIFGGVSQSVAEDMLQESSSSEEVDELIEKHQEDIDEIQNFIVWAHNDEHEWAIKNGMTKDIVDKITDYFPVGRMVEDDRGAKSWLIKGDLRDYINEQWDNTDTYQYHEDYSSSPIEDWLLDMTITNNITDYIFATLIEEEYKFWSYCEGKQGECLRPDTKWFDGYWHPNVDINYSLADRLDELKSYPHTYQPEGETKPLDEQTEPSVTTSSNLPPLINDRAFFLAVSQIVKNVENYDNFVSIINDDSDSWSRWNPLVDDLKLLGFTSSELNLDLADGLAAKLIWAAFDNYQGIDSGEIKSFAQLKLRPLKNFNVEVNENVQEYIQYTYIVPIKGYDSKDVIMEVQYDEDGIYNWWDYEDEPGYIKDYGDSDSEGKEVVNVSEVDDINTKRKDTSINEEIKASPLENDIIDELKDILSNWKDKEHQQYKNIKNLVDYYINDKGINENQLKKK